MSSSLYRGLVACDLSLVFELIILSYSFLSVVFTPWFSWKKGQNHTKGDQKHNSCDTLFHCFLTDSWFFFLLFFSAVFVNAGHELHNVSGHLSVNWSYLIIEMKTVRQSENQAKCLLYGILLWKSAVRRGGFRWCTEYISWPYSLKSSDRST